MIQFKTLYNGKESTVALNPNHVVSVNETTDLEDKYTLISTTTGNWRIDEDFLEVVGRLNAYI